MPGELISDLKGAAKEAGLSNLQSKLATRQENLA
jgi:hypothetical protein